MRVVTDPADAAPVPRALALGTFDGVHIGHRRVIGVALREAAERGLRSTVVTFDRHPLTVIDPARQPRLLTSLDEKRRLIDEIGPDELVVLPFDRAMADMTPHAFCADLLAGVLRAQVVVVGENFNFGAGGRGDAAGLRQCGREHGYETVVVDLVTERGRTISSTRIRRLLREGELEEVREILGRPPHAVGQVVVGVRRGRTLGFPTANIEAEAGAIFPGVGVYAARAYVGGRWYRAAVNVGHNPTFASPDAETARVSIEAHLLDFEGDLYDRELRLDFLHRLRGEERFASVDELVEQMRRDVAETAALDDPAFVEAGLGQAGG
jgi:riboflavin kinase / FMN adenylyltransferase